MWQTTPLLYLLGVTMIVTPRDRYSKNHQKMSSSGGAVYVQDGQKEGFDPINTGYAGDALVNQRL